MVIFFLFFSYVLPYSPKLRLFDVSKQVVGQMFVHGVNVLISDLVSHHSSSNACVSYFLNILLDTTLGRSASIRQTLPRFTFHIGVGLLYLILRTFAIILTEKLNLKGFESGKYGSPPSIFYWARQAAVYVLSLTTMKLLVFLLIAIFPVIFNLGEWLLSWTWTEEGDSLQVILCVQLHALRHIRLLSIAAQWASSRSL
jgi:STIMATE family